MGHAVGDHLFVDMLLLAFPISQGREPPQKQCENMVLARLLVILSNRKDLLEYKMRVKYWCYYIIKPCNTTLCMTLMNCQQMKQAASPVIC